MKNFRVAQVRALVPGITALSLLWGTALMTRAVCPAGQPVTLKIVEAAPEGGSRVGQCRLVTTLLEQGSFTEAERLLTAMPVPPISIDAEPDTELYRIQSQALWQLGEALLDSAIQLGSKGEKEEAMGQVRFCRALIKRRVDNPQARMLFKKLTQLADNTEARLRQNLI